MLGSIVSILDLVVTVLRPVIFAVGALTAVAAALSYAARTRRISPFSGIARFMRERVDPWLVGPMERRLLRAGGTPASAPWWALAALIVGGLLLLSGLEFLRDQLAMLAFASAAGAGGIAIALVRWVFGILRIALFARVIASWVGGSPYSKWWRWAFVLTEPILAPLRRIVPTIGMIDITVIVAYFGLQILEGLIVSAL